MTSDDYSNHDNTISDPGRQACVDVVTVEPALLSAAGWLRLINTAPAWPCRCSELPTSARDAYDVRSGRQQQTLFVIKTQI